jgi:hypothetical protein
MHRCSSLRASGPFHTRITRGKCVVGLTSLMLPFEFRLLCCTSSLVQCASLLVWLCYIFLSHSSTIVSRRGCSVLLRGFCCVHLLCRVSRCESLLSCCTVRPYGFSLMPHDSSCGWFCFRFVKTILLGYAGLERPDDALRTWYTRSGCQANGKTGGQIGRIASPLY